MVTQCLCDAWHGVPPSVRRASQDFAAGQKSEGSSGALWHHQLSDGDITPGRKVSRTARVQFRWPPGFALSAQWWSPWPGAVNHLLTRDADKGFAVGPFSSQSVGKALRCRGFYVTNGKMVPVTVGDMAPVRFSHAAAGSFQARGPMLTCQTKGDRCRKGAFPQQDPTRTFPNAGK